MKRTAVFNASLPLFLSSFLIMGIPSAHALFEKNYLPTSQPAGYKVTLASSPSPPELGENLLDISVKDETGKSVQNVQVTLTAAMPGMKMSTDDDQIATENKKNGHYVGKVDLSMGGKWRVVVHMKRGQGPESTATFEFDIKWE